MKLNISKELFETVMNEKIMYYRVEIDEIEYDYVKVNRHNPLIMDVNDFFFMCKDWALKQNISMYSYIHELNGGVEIAPKKKCNWLDNKRFKADSEQQAVFDACQWILDNKGNK